MTSISEVQNFVKLASRTRRLPSILVTNAGGIGGQRMRPVDDMDMNDWHRLFAINLDGTLNFIAATVPSMRSLGYGAIVTISSYAGRSVSQTGIQAYASSKAGVIGLTRQLAVELGGAHIRVNSVAPGFVLDGPTAERWWSDLSGSQRRSLAARSALNRVGTARDIATVVAFLVSDSASWVTGQIISVDGGHYLGG